MAKKSPAKSLPDSGASINLFGTCSVDENGVAPNRRIPNCESAYQISLQLLRDNASRDRRNSRIYKCYKMFAPTDYSEIARKEMMGLSNTPFGQMKYRVDNRKGTFFDMVAQRTLAAQITTKHGNKRERKLWSDAISVAFNQLLNEWDRYYYNVNMDIEEMSLYGKGFEVAEGMDGWPTRSYHNSSILVPDYTYADLSNLGEFCIKRSYTPLELWGKISNGNEVDEKRAKEAGWNTRAVIDCLRYQTNSSNNTFLTSQAEWLRQVSAGNLNLSRYYNQRIDVFELIAEEYDKSISKMVVLQNYGPLVGSYNEKNRSVKKYTEEEYRDGYGFLFYKPDWVSAKDFKEYGWSEVICPMVDIPGSGLWHEIKGFAEGIFSQCRYYDMHMNRIMDAMDWNMKLLLSGGSAEGTKKIKQMDWTGPAIALPEDVQPLQHRFEMPMERALAVMDKYMADVDRGTAQHQPAPIRGDITAEQARLDAAENAKIRGTELSQFNLCQTVWLRTLFRRLMRTKTGGEGYELKKKFEDFLSECEVPKEAYDLNNIESINSLMLSGAGSVSFKLMASQQLITLTGMTPANEGQEAAIRDGIAAIGGVQNLEAYRPRKKSEDGSEYRTIAQENLGFASPFAQAESLKVEPTDNHLEHLQGHFSDMNLKLTQAEQQMQAGQIMQLQPLIPAFALEGAHMVAHLQYLSKDQTKEREVKALSQQLNVFQKRVDAITSAVQQAVEAQQPEAQSKQDQDLQYIAAKNAMELKQKSDLAEQKRGERALDHQQRNESRKDQVATDLAAKRAKAATENEIAVAKAETENQLVVESNGTEQPST